MHTESFSENTKLQAQTTARYRAPIWTLLVLAPVIAEVLSGSTRLSILFVLVPEIMVWGGGALLAREMVRRWHAGAVSLMCLGLALSIAEEFLIQQTSVAPLPFPGANISFGRYAGVNWIYLLFMLGFETVWVVLVPVQVTELIFPHHREKPWLRTRGLIATCVAFLLGSRIAWYGWTQQARPRLQAAPYHPPAILIFTGVASITMLIGLAWLLRTQRRESQIDSREPAHPWLIGLKSFIFGAAWFALITLVFLPHPSVSPWVPLIVGPIWAVLSFALIRYWSAARRWRDIHRFALSFGAVLGCIVPSDISAAGWSQVDLIAKFAFQFAAVIGFSILAKAVWQREAANRSSCL